MHKQLTIAAAVLLSLAAAGTALAHDVSGRVTVAGTPAGDEVVVWIDGAPSGDVPAKHVVLAQSGIKFSQSFLVVVVGQTVDMPNDDNIAHNVYSMSAPKRFNLGVYGGGETRSVTFDKPGVVDLSCWLHKRMNATVLVVPNRFFARADGGAFRITGLPGGTYRVVASRRGAADISKNVVVSGGAVSVDFNF